MSCNFTILQSKLILKQFLDAQVYGKSCFVERTFHRTNELWEQIVFVLRGTGTTVYEIVEI